MPDIVQNCLQLFGMSGFIMECARMQYSAHDCPDISSTESPEALPPHVKCKVGIQPMS